jgi:dynein heavy chain
LSSISQIFFSPRFIVFFFIIVFSEPTEGTEQPNTDVSVFPWDTLTKFQQLLLLRVLCSDMLVAALGRFVQGRLGEKYLSSGGFDLKEIYDGSTAKAPLIFILSPGE